MHLIEQPQSPDEMWLLNTVQRQAQAAGIKMPGGRNFRRAPNAFATGWNRNDALVAVSTGLLQSMNRDEVEAVMAHEISHVANGDMVTLTLIQGAVVNTFVVFFSRIIGHVVDRVVFKGRTRSRPGVLITSLIAQFVLGILASMIVMWFSRWREYRADAGSAQLAGRDKMISALRRLQQARIHSRCRTRWRHSAFPVPVSRSCLPAIRRWKNESRRCSGALSLSNSDRGNWFAVCFQALLFAAADQ